MQDFGKKPIYLYRHMHNGRTQIVPCTMSMMSMSDYGDAVRLHKKVAQGLGPEIYVPTTEEELERLLRDEGLSVGVWHENRLICMRSVQTAPEWVSESLEKMGLDPDPKERTAVTDHCIVDKEYRGNNIQFFTSYEIECIVAEQFDKVATTVAPMNIFSLQNIINCNFHIVGLDFRYGGYLRYTLIKNFRADSSIWTNDHHLVPIRDISEQKKLIEEGFVGYKLKRMPHGFTVFYAPMRPEQPLLKKHGLWSV
ncbi:MAG: hypothetical protein LBQ19_03815 [Synergistaceae bacterium]|jgi:hypothetical protein|nr:hypothetical protein [Synergistaceae bacterium]